MTTAAPHAPGVAAKRAAHVTRARIALVGIGLLYAWGAAGNYYHLRPFRDGSLFTTEPTGELQASIDLAFSLIVFAGCASVVTLLLAVVAGKRTAFALGTATLIFAVYTALRVYQTDGQYLSIWLWWVPAIGFAIGWHAAYKARQLRAPRQLPTARLVT